MNPRKISLLALLLTVTISLIFVYTKAQNEKVTPNSLKTKKPSPSPQIFPYKLPDIPKNHSYRIVLVGDSMTRALGINAEPLRQELIKLYPEYGFVTYNYAIPSTSILTLPNLLTNEVSAEGQTLPPILNQGFELIIIESFAYNPPSELPLKEGLKKHDQILDQVITRLIQEKPNTAIALMVTLAPSHTEFAKASRDLSPEIRRQWVEERIAYINNHIKYAREKGLPLINVYQKSRTPEGEANLDYINEQDNIHPSQQGINLIAQTIAEYIYQNRIFPPN